MPRDHAALYCPRDGSAAEAIIRMADDPTARTTLARANTGERTMRLRELPFAEESWRHIPCAMLRCLGSPTHHCEKCVNRLAVTCVAVHTWFYTRFDRDVRSEPHVADCQANDYMKHIDGTVD